MTFTRSLDNNVHLVTATATSSKASQLPTMLTAESMRPIGSYNSYPPARKPGILTALHVQNARQHLLATFCRLLHMHTRAAAMMDIALRARPRPQSSQSLKIIMGYCNVKRQRRVWVSASMMPVLERRPLLFQWSMSRRCRKASWKIIHQMMVGARQHRVSTGTTNQWSG